MQLVILIKKTYQKKYAAWHNLGVSVNDADVLSKRQIITNKVTGVFTQIFCFFSFTQFHHET